MLRIRTRKRDNNSLRKKDSDALIIKPISYAAKKDILKINILKKIN